MKALKIALWLLAAVAAALWYFASNDESHQKWGLAIGIGYLFWLVMKQMGDAEARAEARFDHLEDLIRARDEGLSVGDREGLSEMIYDYRQGKRESDPHR